MVHGTRIKIMVRLHNYCTVWQRCMREYRKRKSEMFLDTDFVELSVNSSTIILKSKKMLQFFKLWSDMAG